MLSDDAYRTLVDQLAEVGSVTSLAELHGTVAGVMCAGGYSVGKDWLDGALREWNLNAEEGAGELIVELALDTWQQLAAMDLTFEPLLPDDHEPMEAQVQELAFWCHGFLTGLGLGGLTTESVTAGDSATVREVTHDFAELSRATVERDAAELAATGFALAEIKEYVRVSAQLVFAECGARMPDAGNNHVH